MNFTRNGKIELPNSHSIFTHVTLESKGEDCDHVKMSLSLLQGTNAWQTNLTPKFFTTNSSRTNTNVKQYVDMLVEALGCARNTSTEKRYVCEIVYSSADESELIWKKKLHGDDMVYKLGVAKLTSEDIGTLINRMLSFGISETERLESSLVASDANNAQLLTERDEALVKFRQAVDAKDEVERDLFAKFVSVLNAKKAKIRQLQETSTTTINITEKERTASTASIANQKDKRVTKRPPTKRPAVKRPEPMAFEDSESDTEDGLDMTPPRRVRTDAAIASDQDDDDMFPAEAEDTPECMPLRARIRPAKNNSSDIDKPSTSGTIVAMSRQHQPQPSQSKPFLKNHEPELHDATLDLLDDM